jgi:tRNA 2-thiouridine synthesizing protein A
MKFNVELDVRQLACPLPILRAKKSLAQMSSGEVLKILATDKGAPLDFLVFCDKTSNELILSEEKDGEFLFMIRCR